ncbi:heme ABC exporter ATP-binding protein CcmA [Mesorhizobium xinjiangense]|uniref:heme ABC exporter ATP-binding protein CcmA n=1 Tax=Mesorhizobium xinjiangense TaxID=2678685 RepID=UPI0012ED8021|nr:heme ABC exporter ATP-binding protein CcmA [Mesorhizobium xinjiangense]
MRLVADNLAGERGGETIFSKVGFTLDPGGCLLVTGPNGAGKSTLLRVVAGLLPVAAGTVGLESGGERWPDPAAACHYLGHLNGMKVALTVEENLRFWQQFMGEMHLAVDAALDSVGLGEIGHLPFAYLSTGQKRRAAIARLLVSHRPVWLLDEPTAGLDTASEAQFAALMRAHLKEGGMIVAATHLPLAIEGAGELRMGGNV